MENTSGGKTEKDKKGGFGLPPVITGAPVIIGGATPGLGSAAGASFLAGKAGLVAIVLGCATVAAGLGVVYNYMGHSRSGYAEGLFQSGSYEERAEPKDGFERAMAKNAPAVEPSTLDMFKEQAKKDELNFGDAAASAEGEKGKTPEATVSADASVPAPGAEGSSAGGAKLQAGSGFSAKSGGGGGNSSAPRMQGGGLSGGVGSGFDSVYRPVAQANSGKTSSMGSAADRVNSSPKYAIRSFNKKGAFGQAKFSRSASAKAGTLFGGGARAGATDAFTGGTTGGETGTPAAGAGLNGAGISNGPSLKANDPNLDSSNSSVPSCSGGTPEDVTPWKKWTDMALYGIIAAAAFILLAKMCAVKFPLMAKAFAGMAMIAAGVVLLAAIMLMTKYGQKWTGVMYGLVGAALMYLAYQAMMAAGAPDPGAAATAAGTGSSAATNIGGALMGGAGAMGGGTTGDKKKGNQ